jgi:hypothetical protein
VHYQCRQVLIIDLVEPLAMAGVVDTPVVDPYHVKLAGARFMLVHFVSHAHDILCCFSAMALMMVPMVGTFLA